MKNEKGWMSALELLGSLSDLIILNFLFFVCSIPVITAGPSACGLFYALSHRTDAQGGAARRFFRGFRQNFLQACAITLFYLFAGAVLLLSLWFYGRTGSPVGSILVIVCFIICLLWLLSLCWVFYLQILLRSTVTQTIANGVRLSLAYPLPSLGMALLLTLPALVLWFYPDLFLKIGYIWVFFWFSITARCIQQLAEPAIQRITARFSKE